MITKAEGVPIHYQLEGQLRARRMRADVTLTTERVVGVRGRRNQATPDIERARVVAISTESLLRMRGVSRRASGGVFLRLELSNPEATVAFLLDETVAAQWTAELSQATDD